jgi:hypothetical protein
MLRLRLLLLPQPWLPQQALWTLQLLLLCLLTLLPPVPLIPLLPQLTLLPSLQQLRSVLWPGPLLLLWLLWTPQEVL